VYWSLRYSMTRHERTGALTLEPIGGPRALKGLRHGINPTMFLKGMSVLPNKRESAD